MKRRIIKDLKNNSHNPMSVDDCIKNSKSIIGYRLGNGWDKKDVQFCGYNIVKSTKHIQFCGYNIVK